MNVEDWLGGQHVLVSGGTQGLGAAIARAAAVRGAGALTISGRSVAAGHDLAEELEAGGTPTQFLRTDLSDVAQARSSVAGAIERFGHLDAVVNAAGVTSRGSMLDTTPELFDTHIAINLRSPFFIMADTIRHLRARQARGSIVNIISISELGGPPYLAPYVAAKAGLAGATRNAAHAHRWDKIRINGIDIGWTATDAEAKIQREEHGAGDDWLARADASVPMGQINRPERLAEFAIFLLSERAGVVTGSVVDWDQQVVGGQE